MRLQPIVYVTDMDRSIAWYSTVLGSAPDAVSSHWTTFDVGGSPLALHWNDAALPAGAVELSLVVDEPLETVAARIAGADPIAEQPFGRSIVVTDPDGTRIQINEHRNTAH